MKRLLLKGALILTAFAVTVVTTAGITIELAARQVNAAEPVQSTVTSTAPKDPVTEFRTEREQLRQQQKSQLNDIIYNADSDAEIIQMAQRQLLDMLKTEEQELTLEGVLQMRGYDGALATVHSDSVNVIIHKESVTQQDAAVILELVMRETGIASGNVKIIPII